MNKSKKTLWDFTNAVFEAFKRNPFLKFLYKKFSWGPKAYHFTLALIGAALYPFSGRRIKVIGVTGTKGKTTTASVIYSIFESAGKKTALLSSVNVNFGEKKTRNPFSNSMPGRFFIQKFLKDAVKDNCEFAVVEVTSQGIILYRHRFIKWAAALITNIAPEHIEAHGSYENYREAKGEFLRGAARGGAKVFINHEDQGSEYFFQTIPSQKTIFYSRDIIPKLSKKDKEALPGAFNEENIAAAVSVARFFGISDESIKKGIANFGGVPGRAEFVQRKPFAAVVDYAHTPDSLSAIYQTVKPKSGRLICVLGAAGGGRDRWKRPEMGKIAAQFCDEIILTDEDPYDENPESILLDIEKGIYEAVPKKKVLKFLNRKAAIRRAIDLAKPGDAVVFTGKGSETAIHISNGKTIPWSERGVVEELLGKTKRPRQG